jgi:hypothetical protein
LTFLLLLGVVVEVKTATGGMIPVVRAVVRADTVNLLLEH